jgi:hypothetical protein
MKLADAALAHEDAPTALVLAGETRTMVDAVDFAPEDRLPLVGAPGRSLAPRRRHGGGEDRSSRAALALYDKNAQQIVDIYRAGALRPLAEQYQKFGDTPKALEIYVRGDRSRRHQSECAPAGRRPAGRPARRSRASDVDPGARAHETLARDPRRTSRSLVRHEPRRQEPRALDCEGTESCRPEDRPSPFTPRRSVMAHVFEVNGQRRTVDVDPTTPLLWVLRETLV